MPVKSYKEGLVFLEAKTLKDITNHSLKLAKVFSQSNVSVLKSQCLALFQYFQVFLSLKACKKCASPINR